MNTLNTFRANFRHIHLLANLTLMVGLCGAGTAQAQTRFSYSTNGAEVSDSKTELIWQRCSVGQNWNGTTCIGTVTTYTHEAALTYAQTQTGWRLPNVKELSSLVDRTVMNPSIDSVAFPATTSANGYWSASPRVDDASYAWLVNFYNGYVADDYRRDHYGQVRLVR